jgi:hypothetical protein
MTVARSLLPGVGQTTAGPGRHMQARRSMTGQNAVARDLASVG